MWNFRKVLQNANGEESVGKFLLEGRVDGAFGIALIKVFGSTVAAITNAGDYLELWSVPSGEAQEGVESYKRIKTERMATALHLDDRYPFFWCSFAPYGSNIGPHTCP